jgi:hypothetical protein
MQQNHFRESGSVGLTRLEFSNKSPESLHTAAEDAEITCGEHQAYAELGSRYEA